MAGLKLSGSLALSKIRPSGWETSNRRMRSASLRTIHPPEYMQVNRSVAGVSRTTTVAGIWTVTSTLSRYGNCACNSLVFSAVEKQKRLEFFSIFSAETISSSV